MNMFSYHKEIQSQFEMNHKKIHRKLVESLEEENLKATFLLSY